MKLDNKVEGSINDPGLLSRHSHWIRECEDNLKKARLRASTNGHELEDFYILKSKRGMLTSRCSKCLLKIHVNPHFIGGSVLSKKCCINDNY